MVDQKIVDTALAMLSVAAAELLELQHAEAVSNLPTAHRARARRFSDLRRVGNDIAALAIAAEVLLRRGEPGDPSQGGIAE